MRAKGTIAFCFYQQNSIHRFSDSLYEQEFTFYSDDESIEEKYKEFLVKLKKYMDEEYGKSYLNEAITWEVHLCGKIVNEIGDNQKDKPFFIYYFPMGVRWEQLFGNITTPIAMIRTFSEQGYRNNEI